MFKQLVTAVTLFSFIFTFCLPAADAGGKILSEKSLESGKNTPVFDEKMTVGDYRITRADEAAVILDIPSSQLTDEIIRFSGNSPIVWARYNGNDAKGRIDITRLERTSNDTVRLVIEPFTPAAGNRWVAAGDPRAMEPGVGSVAYFNGYNPFVNFKGSGDGLWHNINQGAFLAAVGMAQQNTRAPLSFTAIADVRQNVETQTSGNFFRKTTTTTIKSFVKPHWILGLPIEMKSADSFETGYCIFDAATEAECPSGYFVRGGVALQVFNGGNMPMDEFIADVQTKSASGWTVIAYAFFVGITTWLSAGAFAGVNPAAFMEVGAGTNSALLGAGMGAGYAGFTLTTQGGSPTTVQDGVFGATDDGVLQSRATGGFGDPTAAITNNFVRPETNDTQGGFLKLYRGGCPDTYSVAQCHEMGYISDEQMGLLQRPETWRQYNSTYRMREGLKPQKEVPVGAVDPYQLLQNGGAALQ